MSFVYVLKLENDKYYVGVSSDVDRRFKDHQSGTGSSWTSLHKPIKIIEVVEKRGQFDEDNKTKEYMIQYGIDNVRGGTYCTTILSNEVKKLLNAEFVHCEDKCFNCKQTGHYASQCPLKVKLNPQPTQTKNCFY